MRIPILVTALVVAPAVAAQSLGDRVARARGTVRLSMPARPGVCGNGVFIGEEVRGEFHTYVVTSSSFTISNADARDFRPTCHEGPLRLAFERTTETIRELRAAVGVEWRPDGSVTDLGMVGTAEAAEWLLNQATRLPEHDARTAVMVASMIDSVRITDRLVAIIEDETARPYLRRVAMRWLNGQAQGTLRALVERQGTPLELREHALRRLAEWHPEGAAEWIEGIAMDRTEPLPLRERAVRALGEEMGDRARVRALFDRLDHHVLRERVLRVVTEGRHDAPTDWLVDVAMSSSEHPTVRERAVRLLGEHRAYPTADLVRLYDRLGDRGLRSRLIRTFAERGDRASLDKLRAIIESDPSPELRREAQRRLGERASRT